MRKGEQTRQMIVAQAARMFNLRGYFGASLSDLISETRLGKGGIYNHFDSKEALALAAFDYSVDLIRERLRAAVEAHERAPARLIAFIDVFRGLIDEPPLVGGCPVLNTAVEADDTNPVLFARARQAMDEWRELLVRTVHKGIKSGDLRDDCDAEVLASLMTASLEGAVMLSRLYSDSVHMHRVADHLTLHVQSLMTEAGRQS